MIAGRTKPRAIPSWGEAGLIMMMEIITEIIMEIIIEIIMEIIMMLVIIFHINQ